MHCNISHIILSSIHKAIVRKGKTHRIVHCDCFPVQLIRMCLSRTNYSLCWYFQYCVNTGKLVNVGQVIWIFKNDFLVKLEASYNLLIVKSKPSLSIMIISIKKEELRPKHFQLVLISYIPGFSIKCHKLRLSDNTEQENKIFIGQAFDMVKCKWTIFKKKQL